MIPSLAEIASSVAGAFRLFLFDMRGYERFNFSNEGFWRSFFVAFLLAPFYFAVTAAQYRIGQETLSPQAFESVGSLEHTLSAAAFIYILYWGTFPFMLLSLTRLFGVRGRFMPFVITFNWSGIVAVALQVIPFALYGARLLPANLIGPLFFASVIAALVYRASIARTVLGVGSLAAASIVLADLFLTLTLASLVQALF